MTNHIDKSVIDLLKKMQEKHPDDKDLQDFLKSVLSPDDNQQTADESSHTRRITISCKTMNTMQRLMYKGVTDPIVIHEQTGIPMEALAVMGMEVPVHDYVIPIKYTSSKMEISGLVSVKAVSPEDALATFESNLPEILSNIIPTHEQSFDKDSYTQIMDDTDTIKRLTELNENGFIDNIADSGLISPVVKHQER